MAENVRIAANGRLVLPKSIREAVGIDGEARLTVTVIDGEIRLSPTASNVARAQSLFRRYVKRDFTTDEFLADRERD